jgi:Protein of unknown function (DUF3047)
MALLLLTAAGALAAEPITIPPFSTASPGGAPPRGWREALLPKKKPPEFALVSDQGVTVLRVRSSAAAGTLAYAFRTDTASHPVLKWRWKIDRVVDRADLAVKSGDDFAARVYVFFAVPDDELSWDERMTLKLAKVVNGEDLPSAGICYVWDNRHAVGTSLWNPYWHRIRTVVLESGNARAGQWIDERRDLAHDFVAAFGKRGAVPAVTGIAAGNDTDQTGEAVTAWFGDFRLEERR